MGLNNMDMYNRWMSRHSGEKKHTAQTEVEARVRATIAELLNHKWFKEHFQHLSEDERSHLFKQLHDADIRATNNF